MAQLFRTEVAWCADHASPHIKGMDCTAEIGYLHHSEAMHNVLQFQVPVDYRATVKLLYGLANIRNDLGSPHFAITPESFPLGVDGSIQNVFHDQVQVVIVMKNIIQGYYVLML